MNVHPSAESTIVQAPAKLNLFFEILARRNDGYHEVETLMVPIDLCDTLFAANDPSGLMRLDCRWALPNPSDDALGTLPPASENLALRAAVLLRQRAGVEHGIAMRLTKRIPSAAGLGGGSSDAAAALLAANQVWGLGWTPAALAELAAELGSDVPFFLAGGAAVCRGRGERIDQLVDFPPWHFVVVRPPAGLATAQVYAHCQVADDPRPLAPLLTALRSGDTRNLGGLIHNRLQGAAERLTPWIDRVRRELERVDCLAHQMTGSGTAYFGICRHARHARRVAGCLQSRGIGHVYAAMASQRQPLS